jgi:hypothetical protein
MAEVARGMKCPSCDADVPVDAGYTPWCDQCGWNVQPRRLSTPSSPVEKQLAQAAYATALEDKTKPAMPAGAWVIASLVHLFTLLLALASLWMISRIAIAASVNIFSAILPLIVTVGLVVLTLFVQPILRRRAPSLARASHGAFYQLADQTAQCAGMGRTGAIKMDESSSIGENKLGAYLLMALDAQAFVAALALALARRQWKAAGQSWVDAALVTLGRWRSIFKAETFDRQRVAMRTSATATVVVEASRRDADPLGGMLENVLNKLDVVPQAVESALIKQSEVSRQVALYQADRAACEVAGSAAMCSMLAKLRWEAIVEGAIDGAMRRGQQANVALDAVQARLDQVPEREQARIRRCALLEEDVLAAGEAPLGKRMKLMQQLNATAKMTLSEDEHKRMLEELRPDMAEIVRRRWEALH